ncbi:hypothetical protein Q2941_35610 [Bradyrhizobium sp. UFLA05-153]
MTTLLPALDIVPATANPYDVPAVDRQVTVASGSKRGCEIREVRAGHRDHGTGGSQDAASVREPLNGPWKLEIHDGAASAGRDVDAVVCDVPKGRVADDRHPGRAKGNVDAVAAKPEDIAIVDRALSAGQEPDAIDTRIGCAGFGE